MLGLIGYAVLLGASVLDMLGFIDTVAGLGLIGLVHGGLFESPCRPGSSRGDST